MGCGSCGTTKNGVPQGCGDKGHCTSGTCNKRNTYDWLSDLDIYDPSAYKLVEVSFKHGSRKDFYLNEHVDIQTGDMVVVDTGAGYDVGRVSLSGELVRLQMKKKNVGEERIAHNVIRKANFRDLEKLEEARAMEKKTMVRARVIARTIGLEMKLGDVEYQGDKRKATFYYTAEGRIDFRELVRTYAKEFRVKIEMRQIGSRQESARIGGIGSCGRELCCSTWLSDFKSVSTGAARYQNIAINQTKLSGQCGRLKCCLNYELDTYLDALKHFPKGADTIHSQTSKATLIKKDIFKGLMFYSVHTERGRGPVISLDKDRVTKIVEMNRNGKKPKDLIDHKAAYEQELAKEPDIEFDSDLTGVIELPSTKKKKKSRNKRNQNRSRNRPDNRNSNNKNRGNGKSKPKAKTNTDAQKKNENSSGPKNKNSNGPNHKNKTGPKPKRNNRNRPKRKPNSNQNNDRKDNQSK